MSGATCCNITITGQDRTSRLGRSLGHILGPGDLLLLSGDLGAGKTTLTKGIAAGIGIDEGEISSPSFSIIHQYPLPGSHGLFVHADLYRLGEPDIVETGLEELINQSNIVVVEWGNILYDSGHDLLEIRISYDETCDSGCENVRHFSFHGKGDWPKRLREAGLHET
jgi:tRNA threonylcarbamoyladenosine biosynthesis protein TsaE